MRFYDGKATLTGSEILVLLSGIFFGILLSILTFGISLIVVIGPFYCYYEYEKRQEQKMQSLARKYKSAFRRINSKLKKYSTYDFYMVIQNRRMFQKKLSNLLAKLEEASYKYYDLWDPIIDQIHSALDFLQSYNERYIEEQKIRYSTFFDGSEYHDSRPFNDEQIRAILTNEFNNLIVAGPGAGKTRALTSRVAFFVLYKNIPQDRILVLTYNKSAAEEIKKRLKNRFGITSVAITTFHSLGYRVLYAAGKVTRSTSVESNNNKVIGEIVDRRLEENHSYQSLYLTYLAEWRAKEKRREVDDEIVEERLRFKLRESYVALDGTLVKSLAEREIANFFIQHAIEYKYETEVDWCDKDETDPKRVYCPDFYLPEYDVYIEHWGVTADNETPDFFTIDESEKYLQDMEWKITQFEKNGKTLWETNHTLYVTGELLSALKRKLDEIGVIPEPISYSSLLKTTGLDQKQANIVEDSIINAIKTSKIYGLNSESLGQKARSADFQSDADDEAQFILDLVLDPFESYEKYLKEENKIDYEDMINNAVLSLEDAKSDIAAIPNIGPYDMVMVDEFQDISFQRLKLLGAVQELNPDCRLFCVGDDWQAIYGFAGSSAHYMINFEKWFPSPARVDLTKNYRNPPETLDFSIEIIESCSEKLAKTLITVDKQDDNGSSIPLAFKRIGAGYEGDFRYKQNKDAVRIIQSLMEQGISPSEILVLSRFNFGYSDLKQDCGNKQIPLAFVKDGETIRKGVRFMSIHKSKGLEADYVLLLNTFEGLFGFPPEITSKLSFTLINPDLPDRLDEERRLLFVASTRARKQCIVYTWKNRESVFLTNNTHYKNHFPKHNNTRFEGYIVNETDKAYKIEVVLTPSFRPLVWIPKSVIRITSHGKNGTPNRYKVSDWWFEKEKDRFDPDQD